MIRINDVLFIAPIFDNHLSLSVDGTDENTIDNHYTYPVTKWIIICDRITIFTLTVTLRIMIRIRSH